MEVDMNKIRFIDLFSGIGGFRLGLERAGGFRCVWSNDFDQFANQIYIKNFGPENHNSNDISTVKTSEIPQHDILCGGFPCQAFSSAGRERGFEDTRGTLFFEIVRIVNDLKPEIIFLENVKGLLYHERGKTFSIILKSLEELGYWWEYQVVNSINFGVPQHRERVFIIGHLREGGTKEIFPITSSGRFPNLWKNTSKKRRTLSKQNGKYRGEPMIAADRSRHARGQGRRLESQKRYSNTITSVSKDNYVIVENGIRILTPIEQERLQGFPDNWTYGIKDSERNMKTANAVTVNVVEFLGHRIKNSLLTVETKRRPDK